VSSLVKPDFLSVLSVLSVLCVLYKARWSCVARAPPCPAPSWRPQVWHSEEERDQSARLEHEWALRKAFLPETLSQLPGEHVWRRTLPSTSSELALSLPKGQALSAAFDSALRLA